MCAGTESASAQKRHPVEALCCSLEHRCERLFGCSDIVQTLTWWACWAKDCCSRGHCPGCAGMLEFLSGNDLCNFSPLQVQAARWLSELLANWSGNIRHAPQVEQTNNWWFGDRACGSMHACSGLTAAWLCSVCCCDCGFRRCSLPVLEHLPVWERYLGILLALQTDKLRDSMYSLYSIVL